MSQSGILDIEATHPQIATSYTSDAGTAIPIANNLELLGGEGIDTSAAGKTITISGEDATAGINVGAANKGIAAFDSADFTVTNGFVQISGSFGGVTSILTDDGAPAVEPNALGEVSILGGPGIEVNGTGPASTITVKLTPTSPYSVQVGDISGGLHSIPIATDGQVLLGVLGSYPKFNFLTSADGSVDFTVGPGSLDLSALGIEQDNIIYVGKHGNNANDGLTINKAKLTFGSAITKAGTYTPSAVNRFAIVCLDDGIYTETVTCVQYVDIFAPNAKIAGSIVGSDNCQVKFRALDVVTGTIGISKVAGAGYFTADVDTITCAGTGIGVLGVSGSLCFIGQKLYVENGFGIGDLTTANQHMHVCLKDIYISGTGTGIARAGVGTTFVKIDEIEDIGAGATTAVNCILGTINLMANEIETDTGILMTAGVVNCTSNYINCTAAYNMTNGELNLHVCKMVGTETYAAGTRRIVSAEDGINNVIIGDLLPAAGTFSTVTDTERTQYAIAKYGASGHLEEIGPLTDGQLIIGDTGATAVAATLTAGAGINITNSAGASAAMSS